MTATATGPSLTPAGFAWAQAHYTDSIVARIALLGHEWGWPLAHTTAAINACNKAAGR